jgi:pyruvate dehydrogenase E2 component (dihydrolipoamide acetyltransferase)
MTSAQIPGSVAMPRLSDGMEDGTIIAWLIEDGASVEEGEDLVEIETDKATAVYPAPSSGTLRRLVQENQAVVVGEPIATIGGALASDQDNAEGDAAGVAAKVSGAAPMPSASAQPNEGEATKAPIATNGSGRLQASPLARRRAQAAGIDLDSVVGTGLRGRITQADVARYVNGLRVSVSETSSTGGTDRAASSSDDRRVAVPADDAVRPLNRAQVIVARRMSEAKATIPDFQTTVEIEMDECLRLRTSLRQLESGGTVPSYNDMAIRASALALAQHHIINSSFQGDSVRVHGDVNIGMAVAADSRLVVPVITNADRRDLIQIAAETRRLAESVRAETVSPAELSGATFTVSNLGMLGVDEFTAIVTPGQAAILSVGSVVPRVVVRDGEITTRSIMRATLSADHRIIYGADAARFLATVKRLLELPVALLTASVVGSNADG